MNKRIEELAEQCTRSYRDGNGEYIDQVDTEKFAELIVRECAQFIFVLDAEPMSHKSAAKLLLDHFGIK